MGPYLTTEEIQAIAENRLSNFEGNPQDLAILEGYTGRGDAMVDFGGINASFANEINQGRIYTVTLVNANAATRYALLAPGIIYVPGYELNGIIRTGAFNDTGGNAGLTGSASPQVIERFLAFCHRNPNRFGGFKITSTVATQIDQNITFTPQSPYKSLESYELALAAYQDENTYKDKVVTVPFEFSIDDQFQILLPVVGSSTCTITFFGGAILNTSYALAQKASLGKATCIRQGVAPLQVAGKRLLTSVPIARALPVSTKLPAAGGMTYRRI